MGEDPRDALIATVRHVMQAFNRRDVEEALAWVTPDCELRPLGTRALTGRDCYRGADGIREYFADVARVWPDGLEVEPVDCRAVAGSVVVFGRVRGIQGGDPLRDEVVWVWRLRDGLVATGQVFSTRTAAMSHARAGA
jgi:ketosteroid isomerase-like protein